MAKSTFKILGMRVHTPSNNLRDVECMQKILYNTNKWFYFYQGVQIDNEEIRIPVSIFKDELIFDANDLCISISAIVGANGSGKSSIIEMMIRVLNNLATSVVGEGAVFPAAEHLHFINNVYGSIAVLIGDDVKIIDVQGRDVIIDRYVKEQIVDKDCYLYSRRAETYLLSNNGNSQLNSSIPNKPENYVELANLFYTIVCNYSMYAYNYQDFIREADSVLKNEESGITEDDVWLKGVFHKNDGYQTPIVLHPMRNAGNVDVPKENRLAKERLLSMLFICQKDENGRNNFPYRTINETLEIKALSLFPLEYKKFSRANILQTLIVRKNAMLYKDYDHFYNKILDFWMDFYGLNSVWVNSDKLNADYVVYKTLKIIRTYKPYGKINRNLFSMNYSSDLFAKHMNELAQDRSHITVKLRRALCQLKYRLYNLNDPTYKLDELFKGADDIIKQSNLNTLKFDYSDFLPPPTTNIVFQIVAKENISPDGKYSDKDVIPFEGLSSGQRQIAYTVSNILYHLTNIDSVKGDSIITLENSDEYYLKYKYVNIILDEVELYFHPDLQRKFINFILSALKNIKFNFIEGVNILLVTHSPFVLSDLPKHDILFLNEKEEKENGLLGQTYCANIHDMLNRNFFMKYSFGENARKELDHIIMLYNHKNDLNNKELTKDLIENRDKYDYIESLIADEYLKRVIDDMLRTLYQKMSLVQEKTLDQQIFEMEQQLKKLKEERGKK